MKKLFLKPFLPVLFLCVVSCGNNPSKKESYRPQAEFITFNSSITYGEGQPELNFNFVLPDIAGDEKLKILLWDLFYDGQNPQLYSEKVIQEYEEQYRELEEGGKETPDMPDASPDWEYSETFNMAYFGPRFLEFLRDREYFTGGAHGMHEIAWFVIDRETNKRLLPRDLIPEKYRKQLELSVEDALRARAGIAPGGALSGGVYFEDKIEITDNFYFSAEGINFCWDPYEIAPYSEGPIQVLLKHSEVSGYLNDLGKALANETKSF